MQSRFELNFLILKVDTKKFLDVTLLLNIRNLEMNAEGLQKNFIVSEDID